MSGITFGNASDLQELARRIEAIEETQNLIIEKLAESGIIIEKPDKHDYWP